MGIRSLLIPFAYVVAVVLKKTKISIWSIVLFSFLVIFFTIFAFYMVAASFYSKWFEIITIAGIFLTGFLDDVTRELSKIKKLPTFPRVLARHSDLLLVFGILYISMVQPYGLIPSLNVDEGTYYAIGILMFFGVLIADFMARKMEKRGPGMESRAERMYLLTGFMLVGLYFNEFLLAIFVGLIGITLSLYVWISWRKLKNLLDIAESLYIGLLKLPRRVLAGGLNLNFQKTKIKIPVHMEGEKEEDFQEYGAEEYTSTSGHNFTAVVNDGRSEPVSNVKVSLLNVETGETYTGYTDPSGRASFVGVAEGQYNITLVCEGYKKMEFERYISMDSGEVFVLKKPFSDLSIVISDKKKTTPVPNAEVSLKLPGKDRPTMTRSADNLGVAYFDELDVGTYEIHVKAEGYNDWKRSINLEEENVVAVNLERVGAIAEPAKAEAEAPKQQNQKEEEKVPQEAVSLSEMLTGSALFEYSSPENVHAMVSQMAQEYQKHDRDVFLVSTPERAEEYKKDLGVEITIIDLIPPETGADDEEKEGPPSILMSDLDQFKNVLENMPAGSVLIFEPLSKLILTLGFGPAFKFVSKTLDYMSGEGLSLACLLNPSAHDKKEVEKLRSLLKSVARIEGGKLFR